MSRSTDEAGERTGADPVEGRGHRVRSPSGTLAAGTPSPITVAERLRRIAKLVEQAEGRPLNNLGHHIDLEWLREAASRTRKDGAPGVDGVHGDEYFVELEKNLQSLHQRVQSMTYWAPPVRGVEIPKGDGKSTRPLGIPTFEDKVFQRAVVMLLEPLYEPVFHRDSYGFRPGRSAHQALNALRRELESTGGGWLLEVDIRKFFDTLDHEHLVSILQQKVQDGRVLQWIVKWLKAGVMKDGGLQRRESGTPQGGVISPLLANVYLDFVLDRWFEADVRPKLEGAARLIRYADDFVIVFETEIEARKVMAVLPKRFEKYGLTVHPDKTKLIPFHRPRSKRWRGPDDRPRPGTFELLGFKHFWSRNQRGTWWLRRKTASSRMTRSLKSIRAWCKLHRHDPIRDQSKILSAKLRGHFRYYGIDRGNLEALWRFSRLVFHNWYRWLSRRSQKVNHSRLYAAALANQLPPPRLAAND
jgi:RNA-directed DNA polymerase